MENLLEITTTNIKGVLQWFSTRDLVKLLYHLCLVNTHIFQTPK